MRPSWARCCPPFQQAYPALRLLDSLTACAHIPCSLFPTSTPTVSAADASKLATRPAVEVGPLLLVFITITSIAYIALLDTGATISMINSQALT